MSDASSSTANTHDIRLYWLQAVTPLHVGSGRGIGFIDLPVMREVVTNWPFVPGSAVKGVLADHHGVTDNTRETNDLHRQAFGRGGDEHSNSGSLVFSDARLVCLPVRSLYGTFAFCTSPLALERLRRDLDSADLGRELPGVAIPGPTDGEMQVHVTIDPPSVLSNGAASAKVFFEDLDFRAVPCQSATDWAKSLATWIFTSGTSPTDQTWPNLFKERFAVVHDDVFNFLCETALQVDARVKISKETKTVDEGQLWYEESLPAETILAGIAWCGPVFGNGNRHDSAQRENIVKTFCTKTCQIQIGGKATVGRGQARVAFSKNGSALSTTAAKGNKQT